MFCKSGEQSRGSGTPTVGYITVAHNNHRPIDFSRAFKTQTPPLLSGFNVFLRPGTTSLFHAYSRNPSTPPRARTMPDSLEQPWSDDPNAPKIPYNVYFEEKAYLAGTLIASIFYGTRGTHPSTRPSVHAHLSFQGSSSSCSSNA